MDYRSLGRTGVQVSPLPSARCCCTRFPTRPTRRGCSTTPWTRGFNAIDTASLAPSRRRWLRALYDLVRAGRHFTAASAAPVRVVLELAAQKDVTPNQLSLAWIMRHPAVSSVVLGVRNLGQLDDQLGATEVTFTAEELARLDEVSAPGRAVVPYYLDDSFADWQPARFRW